MNIVDSQIVRACAIAVLNHAFAAKWIDERFGGSPMDQRNIEEQADLEIAGQPTMINFRNDGHDELIVKIGFNPPWHWDSCPDVVVDLPHRTKKSEFKNSAFIRVWIRRGCNGNFRLLPSLCSLRGSINMRERLRSFVTEPNGFTFN